MEHCGYKKLVPAAKLTLLNMPFLSQKLKEKVIIKMILKNLNGVD